MPLLSLLSLNVPALSRAAVRPAPLSPAPFRATTPVRWPAAIDAGQVSELPNTTFDWTATLLEAAGVTPAGSHPPDGASLLPWLVDGADAPQRDLLWRTREQGAIRRGPYKLLINQQAKGWAQRLFGGRGTHYQLFDVTVDGLEKADLAGDHPELVAELRAAWEAFADGLLPYGPSRWERKEGLPD